MQINLERQKIDKFAFYVYALNIKINGDVIKMKKVFNFGFAAVLALLVFSCSFLEVEKTTSVDINIPVKSILGNSSNQSAARAGGGGGRK